MLNNSNNTNFSELFTGISIEVPVLDGGLRRYINLDNAASTPPLQFVQESVNEFLPYYSSVHRGNGYKSQLSTYLYEMARKSVINFLGAHPDEHVCIFGKNTTDAINKLSKRFPFNSQRNVVLTTGMEHHSNDLPWRGSAHTVHAPLNQNGELDIDNFRALLEVYADRVALVAITGASNITGYINPIHEIAEMTHAKGGLIFVDCAQLAPHRKIQMLSLEEPAHLDFVAISAHKMYAPFGTGALVGRIDLFNSGEPDQSGGGTVEIVTLEDVVWTSPPERDEAGSPNTVGAIALSASIKMLESIGMEKISEHESKLTSYALVELQKIPNIQIFGDIDPSKTQNRLGVIPFRVDGISHFKVASILGFEFGIGVRSGCFCAHPYILHLLNVSPEDAVLVRNRMIAGDKSDMPGLIRASFGLYNTYADVDVLVESLDRIGKGNYEGIYVQDPRTGEFQPKNWKLKFDQFFSIPDFV